MSDTIKIYGICDPRTSELRYIGQTTKSLDHRLKGHLRENTRVSNYRVRWFRVMSKAGVSPEIFLIEEVPFKDGNQSEVFWIEYFRMIGCRLTNTQGGGANYHWMSEEYKQRIKGLRSQEWIVTAPNGSVFCVKGLKAFCEKNALQLSSMLLVSYRKQEHHKGWKCRLATDPEPEPLPIKEPSHSRRYTLIDPNGEEVQVFNLAKFCRENGLDVHHLQRVRRGEYAHHKGWRVPNKDTGKIKEIGDIGPRLYAITSPTGEEFTTDNLTGFCRDHRLHPGAMHGVVSGQYKQYKKWTARRID